MLVQIDPNAHYPKGKQRELIEACGLLPYFFRDAQDLGLKGVKEVYDSMVQTYGYGDWSGNEWGTIDAKGTYVSASKEDEDLEPYVSFGIVDGCTLYVYPYAIISLVKDGEQTIISRMD